MDRDRELVPAPRLPGLRALGRRYTSFLAEESDQRWMRSRVAWIVGLGFLLPFAQTALHSGWPATKVAVVLAALAGFAACFAWVIWRNTPALHSNRAPWALAASGLLAFALVMVFGGDGLTAFSIFMIGAVICGLRVKWWLTALVVIPVADIVTGRFLLGLTHGQPFSAAASSLLAGAGIAAFYQQVRSKSELRQARANLARLAVTEERLRIARDLHDILGQRLSAVSLKAELAARLASRDPVRAAAEMAEVADVARAALADVRETVSGYRAISLASEVETARALLTAAGVVLAVDRGGEPLPAPLDECGAWLIREAVTNVIRHAAASRCAIRFGRDGGSAVVEVRDDGPLNGSDYAHGNGLNGLSERVQAARGSLTTGRRDGWFVVRATFDQAAVRMAAPEAATSGRAAATGKAAVPERAGGLRA